MRRKLNTSFFILAMVSFFQSGIVMAQPFSPLPVNVSAAGRGEAAWGDFDNDHDLDLAITGISSAAEPLTKIFRNNEGIFEEMQAGLSGYEESDLSWGDYDDDGDLDLLIAGHNDLGNHTLICINEEGSFTEFDAGLSPVEGGDVCWMDVDMDGDLDIFITGSWVASIYINDDGVFTASQQSFGYFASSSADWADFDHDGDPDLLINGDTGAGARSAIFRNDNGNFFDIEAGLPGLMAGDVHWVDYDNDGNIDAAISGFNDALEAEFHLYRNETGIFSEVFTGIEGFANGSSDWGDYDLDGDLDLVFSGKATGCGAVVSGIYRNDGNDFFMKIPDSFTTAIRCSVTWTDYENDGDLDFLVAGLDYSEVPFTTLYLNEAGSNEFSINTPPSVPEGLTQEQEGSQVFFNWNQSSDQQTPFQALTYAFRLGTTPGGYDIVSPEADCETGFRKVPAYGNACLETALMITQLEPGTYYWSVQAVDQAMEGSAFADEHSFTVTATKMEEMQSNANRISIFPNPFMDILQVGIESGAIRKYRISDLAGSIIQEGQGNGNSLELDLSFVTSGVFALEVWTDDSCYREKIIRR